ncbi:MAG: lycopene cyclase family protein, partial [Litorimonas sp.]
MSVQAQTHDLQGGQASLTIVGAGLSGLVTAWRCLSVNPGLVIYLYETRYEIAGDHTWSFNETDIPAHLVDWFAPFVRYRWDRYDVRFPERERTLEIGYCTGDSAKLRDCVQPFRVEGRLRVHLRQTVPPDAAGPMLDATGFARRDDEFPGWQKFVGHVIRTEQPHGVTHPVIMDATVAQIDGYRFFYLLPFSEHELLVEDTYFSDSPHLSENEVGARIDDYVRAKGWSDHAVLRREKGVLPMMMATDRSEDSAKIG